MWATFISQRLAIVRRIWHFFGAVPPVLAHDEFLAMAVFLAAIVVFSIDSLVRGLPRLLVDLRPVFP